MPSNGSLYFCYGSNLLTSRMHVRNPDAERVCVGRLKDWKFCFGGVSTRWQGSSADIRPDPGSYVVGVVWRIYNVASLDKQEVGYDPTEIQVESLTDGQIMTCRTYVMKDWYKKLCEGKVPIPSLAYKNVILAGARESGLPQDYVDQFVRNVPDNGNLPEAICKLVPETLTG